MKLSVATFRAGTERLNALMQHRQNRRTSAGPSRAGPVIPIEEDQEALLSRRVNSLDFSELDFTKENEPKTPRSATILGIFEQACKDSVECVGGGMMVDGSPRRIPPQPEPDSKSQSQQQHLQKNEKTPNDTEASSGAPPVSAPADSSSGATPAGQPSTGAPSTEASAGSGTSRSRWMKLRTTVQLSGAITQVHKKPPLKREDSFLKRFSTRQIPDPNAIEGSSRRGADGMVKGPFFGTWRSVVNPDENILFYWLSLLTLCLLYNAWTIIARQAFPELQKNYSPAWYVLDSFTDVVFLLDIAFQFRTGYLEQGLMVCESKKLAGHYFRSKSFLMDIIAITPLDLVQLKVGIIPIVRFPRFLKVYRSFRFYYMVESRTIYPNLWRVVNLIHILLLLAHWFGCFYYMLSELEGFVGEWSYRQPIGDYATLSRKYLGSVYWSTLTLTTIGDLATPVTNLQYLFTIISYLIGVFIFATIVGQVGNVITNRNASRLEFERLLDGAKLYMRHHKVPRNMQRRVQRWYDYSWSRGRMQGGGDINSALGILPDKLKTELALHVNLKTLKKVSIFQECQPEFLHDLVLKMKAYIFTPGDLICRKGEVAREMFIIADGILEVISETGKVLTQMKAGDFFGEIGILNLDGFNRRTADVRSVGYSELFSLSREDILAAMKDYPEAQEILQTMGRKRLMEARLAANVGKTGANSAETNVPSNKKGQGDGARKGQPKPRTAVSKLKDDVRSLRKLLRTRSTPTGKYAESDEQVEMKLMPAHQEESSSTVSESSHPTSRRRNASIKKLMRKMHLRGEEGSSSVKGLAECLSGIRSRPERSGVAESPSVSTESSADSSTPLNKALPLLQRVRMLGEQERKAAANKSSSPTSPKHIANPPTEVIGEGLPLLERLKLLRAREQAQASAADPNKLAPREETQKPSLSPKSKNNPLSSLITSAISPGSTSPKLLPKKETISLKARAPEYTGELPLLKKVLLMKIMEDKKTDGSSTTDSNNEETNNTPEPAKEEPEQKTENNSTAPDIDSEKVYLEQFSRTLGFQMSQLSEDIVPATPKPQPRARLNALSQSPSPSKENVNTADTLKQSEPTVKKESKKKSAQTQVRKGRLSRMMAVREDSDENSIGDDDEEDPFVKSTEVQTEDFAHLTKASSQQTTASSESLNGKDQQWKETKLEDGIQEYLLKVMNNMKLAMKAYVVEQQQELQKRIIQLESDTRKKDEIIKSLKIQLKQQVTRASSTFDEVSSIDPSSLSVSDAEDNDSEGVNLEREADEGDQEDEEDRDLDDEEIRILQEKLKTQRKSWPTSVNIGRRKLHNSNKSYSLDEEQQSVDVSNSDELWRLEFPPPPSDMSQKVSSTPPQLITTIPERLAEESSLPESEEEDQVSDRLMSEPSQPKVTASDWEVQMLVQQFERNVRQQRRRHSSGEALTWDKVLHLRDVALIGDQGPESGRSNRHHRRKYSLVEEGTLSQWSGLSMVQSSSHTSLTEARGSQRTMSKSPRRRSYGHQKHFEPPTARKNSMPILPHCSSIGMSRWLSMDDAKSEGCRSQDSSLHTTLSSGFSQETVIGVESRFASVDDVRRERTTGLGMRSPSSPNVVTDRDCTTSFDYAATPGSHLPEWPSGPCLPTISEDEQSHAIIFPPTTSTGRSASLSTLPLGNLPSVSSHNAQSLQNVRTLTGTSCRRRASADFGSRDQARSNSTPDNLCLVNNVKASSTATLSRGSSNNNIVDTPPLSPDSSVVISIPEYEPLLSP